MVWFVPIDPSELFRIAQTNFAHVICLVEVAARTFGIAIRNTTNKVASCCIADKDRGAGGYDDHKHHYLGIHVAHD